MHQRNPGEFADILDAAVRKIDDTDRHPGQAIPGVWTIGGANTPERVIGLVAAKALHRVCTERGLEFDRVIESYAAVSKNISITPKGGPDVMAKAHLRDAANELRRQGAGRPLANAI